MSLDRIAEIANESAIGTAQQSGNPMSFMPLKIFQRTPRKAPSRWIVRALLNPPDRWLLRELFTSVDVLVDSGLWHSSAALRARLRAESIDATLDPDTEMEVRRSSLHLLHTLDPAAAQRVLFRVGDGELVYRAKPDQVADAQQARYRAFAERFATQIVECGPRWRDKWAAGEDRVLVEVVTQTLFGRGGTRSGHTTLLANSGYLDALRDTVTDHLTHHDTYQDVTVARAVVRLAGKVATGLRDGHTLLHLIASPRLDVDTRVQTCWALANAAPRLPQTVMDKALHVYREQSFGTQSVTALRAIIAANARARSTKNLRLLLDDRNTPPPARQECAWWLSLPHGVRAAMWAR